MSSPERRSFHQNKSTNQQPRRMQLLRKAAEFLQLWRESGTSNSKMLSQKLKRLQLSTVYFRRRAVSPICSLVMSEMKSEFSAQRRTRHLMKQWSNLHNRWPHNRRPYHKRPHHRRPHHGRPHRKRPKSERPHQLSPTRTVSSHFSQSRIQSRAILAFKSRAWWDH